MSWGDCLADAWDGATHAARSAANAVGSTAQAAYDWTRDKAAEGADYARDKAAQAVDYAGEKLAQGYDYARDKAIEGYDYAKSQAAKGYQAAADAAGRVVQGAERVGIEARYAQAAGPVAAAKRAYNKARKALGLTKAGGAVRECPAASDKCRRLADALAKAQLAQDAYDETPAPGKTIAGFQRLDPKRDKAELSRLLGTADPGRALHPVDSDFRASVYKRVNNGRTEYVMAFRGTQTSEDWMENLAQGTGQVGSGQSNPTKNQSYARAKKLATKLSVNARTVDADVSFTGHSLGGGMASAASAVTGRPAATFNAAGLHRNTVGGALPSPPAPVDAYFTPTDILNGVQDNGGAVLADLGARIAAAGAKIPWVKSKLHAAGLPDWVTSDDVLRQDKAPKAYGMRHPLPFPDGRPPPPLSGAGVIEGHSMPLVIAGIEQEQKDAGCL